MKKILTSIVALLLCIAATAQTEFRHITYKEALAAAKSENKKVFLDFYTDWCGPCKMMLRDVFPQKSVGEFMNKNFVPVKVNAEKDEGVELAKKYKVNAYPTFVIIGSDEKEAGRVVGSSSAESFIGKLEQIVDPTKSPELIKQKYESGDRSAEVVRTYANNLTEKLQQERLARDEYVKKYTEVENLVQDYFSGLSDADKVKEENMFVYRQYTNSPFAASGRFIYSSLDKFAEPQKSEVDSLRNVAYDREVCLLVSGDRETSAEQLQTLKKEIKKLGLDKKTDYSAAYALIEGEAKTDKLGFLDVCDKNISKLTSDQQAYLMENFAARYKNTDDSTKKAAAKFLRRHIGEMDFNVMYFTIMQIGELEGRGH